MELNKKDAAIIIKEDLEIELVIPTIEDDEVVSDNIMIITAIAHLLQNNNEAFNRILQDTIMNIIEEINIYDDDGDIIPEIKH